jgi:hypothetical protein
MTNGLGKSDSPVVPEKSPNNAGKPAAEGAEGKGLAKGNLPQQNASRIQSRSNAHSALERVRPAGVQWQRGCRRQQTVWGNKSKTLIADQI